MNLFIIRPSGIIERGMNACAWLFSVPGIIDHRAYRHTQVLVRDAVVVIPNILRVGCSLEAGADQATTETTKASKMFQLPMRTRQQMCA